MGLRPLVLGVALVLGCGLELPFGDRGPDPAPEQAPEPPPEPVCAPADFEARIVAFCRVQNPPSPQVGELGASCANDSQCTSGLCLQPYGQPAYCSLKCPVGDECPTSFSCQDTGTSTGPACYQGMCIYGGADSTDCVNRMVREVEVACSSRCDERLTAWLTCLEEAGRVCGVSDADRKCGIERGLLESCCPRCDSSNF